MKAAIAILSLLMFLLSSALWGLKTQHDAAQLDILILSAEVLELQRELNPRKQ